MAKKIEPPKIFGNKYSLSDHPWEKGSDGIFFVKSMYKMIPAVKIFDPMKKYQIFLENNNNYTGFFRFYVYKKTSIDSPIVRVYIELKLEEGILEVPEDSVKEYYKVV